MPGPDPNRLWIEADNGRFRVCWQAYDWTGNSGNRKIRAQKILDRLRRGAWLCRWCSEPLPDYVRADAQYCNERCRKKAAKSRRDARMAAQAEKTLKQDPFSGAE